LLWPFGELGGGDGGTAGGIANALCPDGGWCELAGTSLAAKCPPDDVYFAYASDCADAFAGSRGSAVADRARHRLVLWGALGPPYYPGNEAYALDLGTARVERLTAPTEPPPSDVCASGDAPSPRATFDTLVAVPTEDRMMFFSGGTTCEDTWSFDLEKHTWTQERPGSNATTNGLYAVAADYDADSRRVLVQTQTGLWEYPLDTKSYKALGGSVAYYNQVGRIDPKRRLFVVAGCNACADTIRGLVVTHLDPPYAVEDWTGDLQGCDDWLSLPGIGMELDPRDDTFVIWPNGGGTIYRLDLGQKRCTKIALPNGPSAQNDYQARGRFRYFPELGLFAVIADARSNAFVLRL
jgi:hypothetical protein